MTKIDVIKDGDTITRVIIGDREICLVGTAHVSAESVNEVKEIISKEKPDHVCVEIDAGRYKSMTQEQSWKNMDIVKIIKEKKGFLLMANLMLSSFQKRMGSSIGMKPGEDMRAAIDTAKAEGITYSFDDRDVTVTLRRAWAKSNFWDKNKVLAALITSAFSHEEVSQDEIEELKNRNELDGMMDALAKELPKVKEVLIDERDQYLATSIYNRPEKRVVAVVGAGHVPGMIKWFEDLENKKKENKLDDISVVPPKGIVLKALPWFLPIIIIGIISAGFITSGSEVGMEMILKWVLANGVLSALGALIALAHPLTIITAFVSAPITSLNPTIGVGIVVGVLETFLRKPRVEDFETLTDSVGHVSQWYKNRILHILLVLALSTVGSAIGTAIGIPFLTSILG